MKIKSLKLNNFRAFIKQQISFSEDKDKNITLLVGDNGKGKSTLIKSIVWCLYQKNLFFDNKGREEQLINSLVKDNKLEVGKDTYVEVEVIFEHKSKIYTVRTFQSWLLNKNRVPQINKETETTMLVTDLDGKTSTRFTQTGPLNALSEIEKILRSDLVPYFFVDGENSRIEKLTEKNNLKEAITRIMGLENEEKMLQFLKPDNSNNSVYELISKRLVANNSQQIDDLKDKIEKLTNNGLNLKEENIQIEEELKKLISMKDEKEKRLLELQSVKTKQLEKKQLESSLLNFYTSYATYEKNIESNYKNNFFIQFKLISNIITKNKITESLEKSITLFDKEKSLSHISGEAIDQIIERGSCVCGTKINNNAEALVHLENIRDYIAPRNYSKGLKDLNTYFKSLIGYTDLTLKTILIDISSISKLIIEIENTKDRIKEIEKEISGYQDAGLIQDEVNQLNQAIGYKKAGFDSNEKSIDLLNIQIDEIEKEIIKLTPKTKDNELNILKLEYVRELYNLTQKRIADGTTKILKVLNTETNNIFNQMYFRDQRKIKISNDYSVQSMSISGTLIGGANTGANAVTNFAFISALIKSAKEFVLQANQFFNVEDEAVYPLFMDAPFSPLGKELKRGVAKHIHEFCDQMVLFVRPDDLEQVIDEIDSKVGKRYNLEFNKVDSRDEIQDCIIKEIY